MGMVNPAVAAALPAHGWKDINVELIANSGHWIADEQPDVVAALIERYAAR
jgi:pimeloyl-ACP methyl ester carboxylesterase